MKTPTIIVAFVKAQNDRDIKAVMACFAADAVLQDEGKKMLGIAAIREWSDKGFQKYQVIIQPTGVAKSNEKTILTAKLTGNFPSSPISLNFHFAIKDEKITALTIQ